MVTPRGGRGGEIFLVGKVDRRGMRGGRFHWEEGVLIFGCFFFGFKGGRRCGVYGFCTGSRPVVGTRMRKETVSDVFAN